MQHSLNGNLDQPDNITVLQLNTGNGGFKGTEARLRLTIEETKAKVIILSEANLDVNNPEHTVIRDSKFQGFNFEEKLFEGNSNARLVMLISKDIEY